MRFLETTDGRTYRLTEDFDEKDPFPAYAILSHTWDAGQEVIFDDIVENRRSKFRRLRKSLRLWPQSGKKGYDKLAFCARQTKRDGLRYFWVDTCCIDKKNGPDLSRSINSMFQWYKNAAKCYVYLSDVSAISSKGDSGSLPWQVAFANSRWFTRGWTLQELLAPTVLEFFSREGICLGSRLELKKRIHEITDIPVSALSGTPLDEFSVDERLSWAVERQTTKEEDEVYALLGIFGINLPLVYDEGYDRTLRRLLDKIDELRAASFEIGSQAKQFSQTTMPFRRDPDFVSRDVLEVVHKLCTRPAGRAALLGLGGVGKSQIAIECCYRILDESPTTRVFWVHAETRERLEEGYLEIAKTTGIDGWDDPKADVIQLFHAWLLNEASGRWLLVFDSADDPDVFFYSPSAQLVKARADSAGNEPSTPAFLPPNLSGSVLVTSRSRHVARILTGTESSVAEVGPMDDQDAFALLQKKFNFAVKRDEADTLITALEHMPLALTQAAAFINRTPRMSISRYLTEVGNDRASLPSKYLVDNRRDPSASNSISITWQISFDYIHKQSPAAARLLSLMSMFDRQGIPKSLLVDKYAEDGQSRVEFDHDIYMLTSFCLVKASADEDSFEMHGLVQNSMKEWLELNGELEYWKEIFVALIDETYPIRARGDWSTCQTLLPHATAALNNIPVDADALEAWASISFDVGWYWGDMGDYKKSHKLLSDSVVVREILLGAEDPLTLDSQNSLGLVLKRLGQYEEAKEILSRVLEVQDRTLGAGDTATMTTKINLASVYDDQLQWIDAEKLLLEVLRTAKENNMEKNHTLVLNTLNLQATVYREQKRWTDAAKLYIQLLETCNVHLGPDNPLTMAAKSNLAFTYRKQGRLKEAESMHLEIIEESLALQVPETEFINSKAHLAQTYRAQGRYDEAEDLQTNILERSKTMLGIDHVDTLRRMSNLAATYRIAGKLDQAQALDEERLELRKKVLGENHVFTIDTKADLAMTYCTQHLYDKAELLQLEVLKANVDVLGENHPATLLAKAELAITFREQGRLVEAEQIQREILDVSTKVSGPGHPDTLRSMSSLAITYKVQGRTNEAIELMGRCSRVYESVAAPGSTDIFGYRDEFERWTRELEQDCKEC